MGKSGIVEKAEKIEKGIYKRGPYSFQVKIMAGGVRVSETLDTLEEARAFRDSRRVAQALDPHFKRVLEARVSKRDAAKLSLSSALDRYIEEVTAHKKSAESEKLRIGKLKRYGISKQSIYQIGPKDILGLLKELRTEGLSENSLRKYAAIISHLYTVAVKRWHMDSLQNPVTKIELPSNGKPRKRRLEAGEEAALIAELKLSSPYTLPMFQLAVETAMRQGELLALEWENIIYFEDGLGVARLADTKNGESRDVPLLKGSVAILKALPRPIKGGKVFPINRRELRKHWEVAREAAGVPDLRWHDLRHEAASRLFELGLDQNFAAEVTGHKTLQMLKDYTHSRAHDLAQKMDKLKRAQ